jgi:hypothetical protein
VEGRNSNSTTYIGRLSISNLPDDQYLFEWRVGDQIYQGAGEIKAGEIIVDWGDSFPAIYVRNSDGTLDGTWANGQGAEKLYPKN